MTVTIPTEQAGTRTSSGTNVIPTPAGAGFAGDLVIVDIAWNNKTSTTVTCTPATGSLSAGVKINSRDHSTANLRIEQWAFVVTADVTAGSNYTVAWTGAATGAVGGVALYSSSESWGKFIDSGFAVGSTHADAEAAAGSTSIATGNITPATAAGLGCQNVAKLVNSTTVTQGTGWTSVRNNAIATPMAAYRSRRFVTATTAYAGGDTAMTSTGEVVCAATNIDEGNNNYTIGASANAVNLASGSTLAVTVPAGGYAIGTLVVIGFGARASQPAGAKSVADTGSNSWTLIGTQDFPTDTIHAVMYASTLTTALSAGDTITYTYGGAVVGRVGTIIGMTGLSVTPDDVDTGTALAANAVSTPSLTIATAGVGVQFCFKNTLLAFTPGNRWSTRQDNGTGTNNCRGNLATWARVGTVGYIGTATWATNGSAVVIAAHFPIASSGPVDTPISVGGTLTPVGDLSTSEAQALAGTVTPAGALTSSDAIALAGTLTPTGALVPGFGQALSVAGTLTPAGALKVDTGKLLSGTVTPAGAITIADASSFTGTLTPAGSLIEAYSTAFAGQVLPTGSMVTADGTLLAGTLSPAGAIVLATAILLNGTLTPAGDLTLGGAASISVGGTLTPTGALTTSETQTLGGTITPAGALTTSEAQTLGGTLSPSGALTESTAKFLGGTITPTGAETLSVAIFLSGTLSPAGALSLGGASSISVGGTLTPTGALSTAESINLTGSMASSGQALLGVGKSLSGAITPTGSLATSGGEQLGGTISPTGGLTIQTRILLGGTLAPVGDLFIPGAIVDVHHRTTTTGDAGDATTSDAGNVTAGSVSSAVMGRTHTTRRY